MKIIIAVLCLLAILTFSYSDLPVHCEFPQIVGEWELKISPQKFNKEIINYCTATDAKFNVEQTKKIKLASPNFVLNSYGQTIGTFTLIYDQGFELIIEGKKYFAFFSYSENKETKKVTSYCYKTFSGTYHDSNLSNPLWGCFQATKITSKRMKKELTIDSTKYFKNDIKINKNRVFKNDKSYIKALNNIQNTWKAGINSNFENKPISEIQKLFGKKFNQKRLLSHKTHVKLMKSARLFQKNLIQKTSKNNNKNNKYPREFTWRNVSGKNFVSPVRHQMNCGSCYLFATLGMYESRERIKTGNRIQHVYSTQYLTNCMKWGQGCDGGFAYLGSKYMTLFGTVKEDCQPYLGDNKYCYYEKCLNKHAPFKKYKSKNYGYVGGYYGASNEENMKEELLKNGPIAVSFEVYPDLAHYKSGVYRHVSDKSLGMNKDPQFVTTNHCVLLTGYGVLNGIPYWEIKNSWGDDFGDNGYFKIFRGEDECGIESCVAYLTL